MKFRATKKEMRNNYHYIIGIGYCAAQFLLKYEDPIAYSVRSEGWACDYYDIDGVLISTGYAPLESKNTNIDYDMIRDYDNRARKIAHDYTLAYEEREKQVKALLKELIEKAKKS